MNRWEAMAKARRRWGAGISAPRWGQVTVVRKSTNVRNREVGYYELGTFYVMGRGTTWEEAFADADKAGAR